MIISQILTALAMVENSYPINSFEDSTRFLFVSEGPGGRILKAISFDLLSNGKWNLGFGDLKNGQIDDMVISNNHDITKVLGAVAKSVFEFSERYPERNIVIYPVDTRRKRLYNLVFQRRLLEISIVFDIFGERRKHLEPYISEKTYDSFELIRKKTTFESNFEK